MKSYAEEYFDQERYAEKQLEKSKLHAKIFNCVFHDILDDLMFVSTGYLTTLRPRFYLSVASSKARNTFFFLLLHSFA